MRSYFKLRLQFVVSSNFQARGPEVNVGWSYGKEIFHITFDAACLKLPFIGCSHSSAKQVDICLNYLHQIIYAKTQKTEYLYHR